ncbi:DUF6801 domain-containing protein [Flexivirga sp. B27]
MSGSTDSRQATSRRVGPSRALTACGALGLATGLTLCGVAFTSSPAHAATTTELSYSCSAPAIGLTFTDPWTVDVETDYPTSVAAGAALHTTYLNADVTLGDDAAIQFRALGVGSWSGSAKLSYAVSGAVTTPGDRSAELTVDTTTMPATGPVTTTATGTAADETAAAEPGTATVAAGDLTADLTTDAGVPIQIECSLPDNADATIASVQVTAASETSSGTPTATATSTPTATSTSTPTATSTSTSTATSTATTTRTGPPVVTDGGSSDGDSTTALVGAGVAAAGVALLGVGSARRMRGKRR